MDIPLFTEKQLCVTLLFIVSFRFPRHPRQYISLLCILHTAIFLLILVHMPTVVQLYYIAGPWIVLVQWVQLHPQIFRRDHSAPTDFEKD